MGMRDDGEPIGRGQPDRRAADARAIRDALFSVAFFTGVMLVNGILVILLIELARTFGWWETSSVLQSGEEPLLSLCVRAGAGLRADVADGVAGA